MEAASKKEAAEVSQMKVGGLKILEKVEVEPVEGEEGWFMATVTVGRPVTIWGLKALTGAILLADVVSFM